ncbi:MAG: hypothetical protein QOF11_2354 [Chloroflexota bacterium]|jgi:hypothetical protein|nr:hypothetical protein [Chloroflexota bacterium]
MDAIFALVASVLGLVALDLAAMRWGSDSRPTIGDDHRRSA